MLFTQMRKTRLGLQNEGFHHRYEEPLKLVSKFNAFKTINQGLYTEINRIKVGHWSAAINEKEISMLMIQKKTLVIHGDYKTHENTLAQNIFK